MTEFSVYWIAILDGVNIGLGFICFFGFIAVIIGLVTCILSLERHNKVEVGPKKIVFASILTIFLSMLALMFTPDSRQAAAIVIIPKIINNEQLQEMPKKILELGNAWLNELKPQKDIIKK